MISCYVRAGLRVPYSRALYSPVAQDRFRAVGEENFRNIIDNRAAKMGFCAFPIMLV